MTSSPIDAVEQLLDTCLAHPVERWHAALEEACTAHPEHADELRRRFRYLEQAGMVDPVAPTETPGADAPTLAAGVAASGVADPTTLQTFAGFDLLSELGRGGMGVVYLARQQSTQRKVALKLIRPDLLDLEKAQQRFRREVEAVSSLDHPGICTVFEAGEADGTPYVAMRYIDGCSIAELIAGAEHPSSQAGEGHAVTSAFSSGSPGSRDTVHASVRVFEQIAQALHAAHEAGILHRDIKPGNIMIDGQGHPVILDFGLARPEDSTGDSLTRTGDQLGTPAYMSPEQISPKGRALDRRTDIYSLGVTLYQCLVGRHPFEATTREELYAKILHGKLADPRRLNRLISKDLAIVITTAMHVDRDRRYQTADALAEDLRRVRMFEPIRARRTSAPARLVGWARREPVRAALAGGLLLATLAGVGLGGFLLAESGVRAAGRAALDTERYEQILARAFIEGGHGDRQLSLQLYDSILAERPDHIETIVGKALLLKDLDRFDEALALSRSQEHPALRRVEARILEQSGQLAAAQARLAELPPAATATDLFVSGTLEIERAHLGDAARFHEGWRQIVSAILHSDRVRRPYLTELLHCATHIGEADRIRQVVDTFRRKWPDEPTTWRVTAHGLSMVDPAAGERTCERFLALHPDSAKTWEALGRSRIELEKWDAGREAFRKARELGAAGHPALLNEAYCLSRLGRHEDALKLFKRACRQFPRQRICHRLMSEALDRAGRPAEAVAPLRRALILGRYQEKDCDRLLILYIELKRYAEAREFGEEAIARHPKAAGIRDRLCEAYLELGRDAEAIKHLEILLTQRPKASTARHLSTAQERIHHYTDAVRAADRAVELDPQDPANWVLAAGIRIRLNDAKGAIERLREVLRREPEHLQSLMNLGNQLAWAGRAEAALPYLRKGHALAQEKTAEWRKYAAERLAAAEAYVPEQRAQMARLQADETPTDAKEALQLAAFALHRGAFDAAHRLYETTLAKHPEFVADYRYMAACGAARAGSSAATPGIPAAVRRRQRDRARYWLRGWLDYVTIDPDEAQARTKQSVRRSMALWVLDHHLAPVRDAAAIARIDADEQAAWRGFWQRVEAFRSRWER